MKAPRRASAWATVALTVAVGGSAYSAANLTGRDVADASLTGDDIRRGTLDLGHFSDRAQTFASERQARVSQDYPLPSLPFGLTYISEPIESGPGFISDAPRGQEGHILTATLTSDRCFQIRNVRMTYSRGTIDYPFAPPTLKRSGYQGRIIVATMTHRFKKLRPTDLKLTGECIKQVAG